MAAVKNSFTGIWHYRKWYPNTKNGGREDSIEFYVRIDRNADGYILHSLSGMGEQPGSYMEARFTVDDQVATGTYLENAAPEGEWEGMVYRGAFQLLFFEDGNYLEGKWVGLGYNNGFPMIFGSRLVLEKVDDETAAKLPKNK